MMPITRLQKSKANEVSIESKRARKKVIHELADKVTGGDTNIIKNTFIMLGSGINGNYEVDMVDVIIE